MARGRGDNGETRFSLELSIDDLPMMVDLMVYGITRAMFSHGEGEAAAARFKALRSQVEAMSPIPRKYTQTGYAWAEACAEARSASQVWLSIVGKRGYRTESEPFRVVLHVDGREFGIVDEVPSRAEAEDIVERVEELMERLVPMEGTVLVRVEGTVAVGGKLSYDDDGRTEAIKEALEESLGEDAADIKVSFVSYAGAAPDDGHHLKATFHVPTVAASRFRDLVDGVGAEPAAPRMR
jgi:hypothetical protein